MSEMYRAPAVSNSAEHSPPNSGLTSEELGALEELKTTLFENTHFLKVVQLLEEGQIEPQILAFILKISQGVAAISQLMRELYVMLCPAIDQSSYKEPSPFYDATTRDTADDIRNILEPLTRSQPPQ